ncbi:MAG: hypothetical protein WAM14_15230 [Candidatus Nitrosopolaris sp.]
MERLILAKCISGVRIDSNDYNQGRNQATSDEQNPVNGTNRERTTCAVSYNYGQGPINSTNVCYAGHYDSHINTCLHFHACNKTCIKPVGYPPSSIPPLPPPPIENSTRLVYDNYYGVGYVQGKANAYADRQHNYTATACPYPVPPYASYCKGYHEAYDFNWNVSNQGRTR